jgi:hypothetical protein
MGPVTDEPIDVHSHLWPPALVEALRGRTSRPFLRGWTLHLDGEPEYEVNPADHDVAARATRLTAGRRSTADPAALISLSSPLGLEDLPARAAAPLLDAWHDGAAALPPIFGAWAAVGRHEPDLTALKTHLTGGFLGLQVPATWLLTPSALEGLAPVLAVCEELAKPVLVHPGPCAGGPPVPGWWPAVVDYVGQLQAAWWAWHVAGRALLPTLRIGFVAGAGLAPLHHERLGARGGRPGPVDPNVFLETSSYGPQAVDALVRALGIDPIVRGSDHPYAEPAVFGFGSAADAAIDVRNPRRFLFGGVP